MSMNVRGPGETQKPQAAQPQGPVAAPQGKPEITGAKALANAEAAVDKLFNGEVPATAAQVLATLGGEAIAKDLLATPEAKQQILALFTGLKSEFLKEKPAGATADAFDHPATQFPAGQELPKRDALDSEVSSLRLTMTAADDVPTLRAVSEGLSVVQDRVALKQIQAVEDKLQIAKAEPWYKQLVQASSLPQMKKVEPQWQAVAHWVLAPALTKTTLLKIPNHGELKTITLPRGKKEPVQLPGFKEPDVEVFDKAAGGIGLRITADMDVSSLLIIIMMLLSKDAEKDLRDMMDQMQATMKLKDAKREMMRALESQLRDVKKSAQEQLDSLKERGVVRQDVTIDEFMDACGVSMRPPELDQETGEWEVFDAKLEVPNPVPASLREEKIRYDKTTGERQVQPAGPGTAKFVGAQQERRILDSDDVTFGNRQGSGGWRATPTGDGKSELKLPPGFVPRRHEADPNKHKTETVTVGDMQAGIDGLRDDLDAMGSQSEMDQMRLQMYMDRRAKAIETLSNSLKKISETGSNIVKNIS